MFDFALHRFWMKWGEDEIRMFSARITASLTAAQGLSSMKNPYQRLEEGFKVDVE